MAQTQFVSFNSKISPGLTSYTPPSPTEVEDMKDKDPALACTWAIWEQAQQTKEETKTHAYSDATHLVASFNTVKGFWKYWNHLPQPSELLDGKMFVRGTAEARKTVDALMVFRDGVKPEWEDSTNATGGHFQFQLKQNLGGGLIDEYWNNIVLGMLGGTIEPADMITGVRLVDKLGNRRSPGSVRIEVWFANFEDTDKVDKLQSSLEKCMATKFDGSVSTDAAWGKTDKKSHIVKKG